jgi:ribosomal protein S18 acetylase RimI-like enzyme
MALRLLLDEDTERELASKLSATTASLHGRRTADCGFIGEGIEWSHMEIREARTQDRPAIRDVARRSLEASYSLGPRAITGAIEEWYDQNRLRDIVSDEGKLLLVVEDDGQVVGFSESVVTGEATAQLLWLHIDPDYRGESYGQGLFDTTREHLERQGINTLQGRVLADNRAGNAFYEAQGLTKVGEEAVDIDGTSYAEYVYANVDENGVEALDVEDETVYVSHSSTETGSIAPFHVVYTEPDREDIYGYWCSGCEDLANAMDAMGRIQCDGCGNARKPTRWDSAYL